MLKLTNIGVAGGGDVLSARLYPKHSPRLGSLFAQGVQFLPRGVFSRCAL
jgi:hypothetical protein